MNRKIILDDPRLSALGTVHETPETLQATIAALGEFQELSPIQVGASSTLVWNLTAAH